MVTESSCPVHKLSDNQLSWDKTEIIGGEFLNHGTDCKERDETVDDV